MAFKPGSAASRSAEATAVATSATVASACAGDVEAEDAGEEEPPHTPPPRDRELPMTPEKVVFAHEQDLQEGGHARAAVEVSKPANSEGYLQLSMDEEVKIRRPPLWGPPSCEAFDFILRLCVSVCLRLAVCILLSGVCRLQSVDDGSSTPNPPSTSSESCLPLEILKKSPLKRHPILLPKSDSGRPQSEYS